MLASHLTNFQIGKVVVPRVAVDLCLCLWFSLQPQTTEYRNQIASVQGTTLMVVPGSMQTWEYAKTTRKPGPSLSYRQPGIPSPPWLIMAKAHLYRLHCIYRVAAACRCHQAAWALY